MNSFLDNVSNVLSAKKKPVSINALFSTLIVDKNLVSFNIFFVNINTLKQDLSNSLQENELKMIQSKCIEC